MTYPQLNSTLVQGNVMELFVYANTVTNGLFVLFVVVGFFLVTLMGSLFASLRFSGRVKVESSLIASCFATLGFATIFELYSGLLSPIYFFVLIGITILSVIWAILSE